MNRVSSPILVLVLLALVCAAQNPVLQRTDERKSKEPDERKSKEPDPYGRDQENPYERTPNKKTRKV